MLLAEVWLGAPLGTAGRVTLPQCWRWLSIRGLVLEDMGRVGIRLGFLFAAASACL